MVGKVMASLVHTEHPVRALAWVIYGCVSAPSACLEDQAPGGVSMYPFWSPHTQVSLASDSQL